MKRASSLTVALAAALMLQVHSAELEIESAGNMKESFLNMGTAAGSTTTMTALNGNGDDDDDSQDSLVGEESEESENLDSSNDASSESGLGSKSRLMRSETEKKPPVKEKKGTPSSLKPAGGKKDVAYSPERIRKIEDDFSKFYLAADGDKRKEVIETSRLSVLQLRKNLAHERKKGAGVIKLLKMQDRALDSELRGLKALSLATDKANIMKATKVVVGARTDVAQLEDSLRRHEKSFVNTDRGIVNIQKSFDQYIGRLLPKNDTGRA
eukprot:TRINITY_DN2234_c0_g1_i4.p1 TRINITY_DN2234_c0_g1~~TRINITY_DN2234_c0_g1_i4.p1  ORF type:complete len:268 (+),score=81.54 TRINITY_DN2234_c0_g1_i4:67-870(+)